MKHVSFKASLILFLGGMLLIHAGVAWKLRDFLPRGYPDFTIFYSAGKIVGHGHGRNLYSLQTQYRAQQEFASQVRIRQGALPYNHPPFEAAIFVPFAGLSYFHAYLLWTFINLLILLALPLLLRPHVLLLHGHFWMCILAEAAFFPIFIGGLQGQDTILLLALISLAYVSLRSGSDFTAGVFLGLGLFRPQFVLPLLLILLLRGKWKVMMGSSLVAGLLGAISAAIVGWTGTLNYPRVVWQMESVLGHGSITPADMPNIRGLFFALAHQRVHQNVLAGLVALASAVLLGFAVTRWRSPEGSGDEGNEDGAVREFDLGFSIALVIAVLVSYHAFLYDLSLLFLPLVLLANHFKTICSAGLGIRTALLAPAVVLLFSPVQIFLSLHYQQANLLVLLFLLWIWGMARLQPAKRNHVASPAALT